MKHLAFALSIFFFASTSQAQMGVGTATPNASAQLDVSSTTKGFLAPRMTKAQRVAIASPAAGLLVYQTDDQSPLMKGFYYYNGSAWVTIGGAGAGTPGADGKTILNGTIDPLSGTGVDGDFYINTNSNKIFGPKVSGAWPAGVSLVGPKGETGAPGTNGTNGIDGQKGDKGDKGETGAPGSNGTNGENGSNGTNGTNGTDGKTILNGTADPLTVTGADGDFYINTTTNTIYGPKASNAWPAGVSLVGPQGIQGLQGPIGPIGATGASGADGTQGAAGLNGVDGKNGIDGANGKTILNGSEIPDNGAGVDGDFYINTTTNTIYGPKASNAWPAVGVSLVGIASIGDISGSANSKGASITAGVLSLSPADGTNPGIVTTGTQTIAGAKTFTDKIKMGAVTYPNTDGTPDQVLTTDGAGNATWAAGGGGGSITVGSVGPATANGASITAAGVLSLAPASASFPGIVTTGNQTIAGAKIFNSDDGFAATGTLSKAGATLIKTGAGTRMMWYPKKAAFRVGSVTGVQWDEANIGLFSFATGNDTKATGNFSTAMGLSTTASGFNSIALGDSTVASGGASNALGYGSIARSYGETVIGMNNTDYTPSSTIAYAASDRLFVIGNGSGYYIDTQNETDGYIKSNALVMLKNGKTTFSASVTAASFTTSSDIRLKKNITPLKPSIAVVMQLNPVSYEKKQTLMSNDYSIKENGFIAQELQKVMPTLVTEGTDKDKILSVNYTALIPVLTKAIQEQQEQLSTQKKEIEELKKMVELLLKKQ